MSIRNTIKGLAAAALCAGALSGCASTAMTITMFIAPNDIDELEKQQRSLKPRYKAQVKLFEQKIETAKKGIDASLEAKDILASSKNIRSLYELTHPCGEDECETFPCEVCDVAERSKKGLPPLNRAEVFIEREGVDSERGFIRESMDLFYDQSSASFDKGEVELVNDTLDVINENLPFETSNRSRFADLTYKVKDSLITTLVGEGKSLESSQPRVAAKKYTRAASLAEELGEARKASDFKAKALSLSN